MKETAISRDDLDLWHLTREMPDFEKAINRRIETEAVQTFKNGKTSYRWEITESDFGKLLDQVATWSDSERQSLYYRYRVKGWSIRKEYSTKGIVIVFEI